MRIFSKFFLGLLFLFSSSIAFAEVTATWDSDKGILPEEIIGKLTEYHYGMSDEHFRDIHVSIKVVDISSPEHPRTLAVSFFNDNLIFATSLHSAIGKNVSVKLTRGGYHFEFTILPDTILKSSETRA